jgi:hypothetical protein
MRIARITFGCGRFAALLIMALGCTTAHAQYPQSYGSYYQKQARRPDGVGPNANVNSYLYDKYFYHKPAVSPYQNLGRRSTSGTSYNQYVRPEQDRRREMQQAGRDYVQHRKLQGNVGHTDYDKAMKMRYGGLQPSDLAVPRSTMPYYYQYGRR